VADFAEPEKPAGLRPSASRLQANALPWKELQKPAVPWPASANHNEWRTGQSPAATPGQLGLSCCAVPIRPKPGGAEALTSAEPAARPVIGLTPTLRLPVRRSRAASGPAPAARPPPGPGGGGLRAITRSSPTHRHPQLPTQRRDQPADAPEGRCRPTQQPGVLNASRVSRSDGRVLIGPALLRCCWFPLGQWPLTCG